MRDAPTYSAIFKSPADRSAHIAAIEPEVRRIERALDALGPLEGEEHLLREAVREACRGALEGSYGIGAVLSHPDHGVIARGHNRLSAPDEPMRHVLHAEMDTLGALHRDANAPRHLPMVETTMTTTLEPCPMCTIGMWNEGVRTVAVGAPDAATGWLVSNSEYVPPGWRRLLDDSETVHRLSTANAELSALCLAIFEVTKSHLDARLTSNVRD